MISSDLYEIVRQYLESSISIQQLEDWIVPRLPDLLSDPDSEDSELVATIELGFAELNNDNIDEDEFKSWLDEELNNHNVAIFDTPEQQNLFFNSTSTSNEIIEEKYSPFESFAVVNL